MSSQSQWQRRQRLEAVCAGLRGEESLEDDPDAPFRVRLERLFRRKDEAQRRGEDLSGQDIALFGEFMKSVNNAQLERILHGLLRRRRKARP
jgi:hypothetical protein